MSVVPSEIIVGPNDKIPGLLSMSLPARFQSFDEPLVFSDRKTVYAHNIRLSSINEIEAGFKQYLRKICMQQGADKNHAITAEVLERKLTMVPHNSWRQIGQEAMISLNEDAQGNIESQGSLKIIDCAMHEMVALLIKLHYRVQIRSHLEGLRIQEFVLGHAVHMMHITKGGNLHNIETQIDVQLGPGSALTGEILWDHRQVRPADGPKLLVKLATIFSLTENLVAENAEARKAEENQGDEALEKLRKAVAEEHKDQLDEKEREILRI